MLDTPPSVHPAGNGYRADCYWQNVLITEGGRGQPHLRMPWVKMAPLWQRTPWCSLRSRMGHRSSLLRRVFPSNVLNVSFCIGPTARLIYAFCSVVHLTVEHVCIMKCNSTGILLSKQLTLNDAFKAFMRRGSHGMLVSWEIETSLGGKLRIHLPSQPNLLSIWVRIIGMCLQSRSVFSFGLTKAFY